MKYKEIKEQLQMLIDDKLQVLEVLTYQMELSGASKEEQQTQLKLLCVELTRLQDCLNIINNLQSLREGCIKPREALKKSFGQDSSFKSGGVKTKLKTLGGF